MGIEVNLGNSDDGSGDNQPFSTDRANINNIQQGKETALGTQQEKELLEDNNTDAPSINTNKNDTKRNTDLNDNSSKKETTEARPKLLFPGSQNNSNGNEALKNQSGTSQGNGSGNGDKGVPGGTEGSNNYIGTPGQGGFMHSFTDRVMISQPNTKDVFNRGGKVTVRVGVNRNGKIFSKTIIKSTNQELNKLALKKIDDIRFNSKDDAPPEQFGNIIFVFKTRLAQ